MGMYLNPGNDKFKRACTSDIYIDKSGLISNINKLIDKENNCISVSRPRRFGKSMTANMLTAYYVTNGSQIIGYLPKHMKLCGFIWI